MLAVMDPKQRAGFAALAHLANDMVVGIGTGSTAACFIDALGAALRDGRLRGIRGIPTSDRSAGQARKLGIPIITFAQASKIDITIDGADEIDPNLNLIKGLGGALLREKLVAQNSSKMIVIADSGKLVDVLGTHQPLPVEVAPFEHAVHVPFLRSLGCEPKLRHGPDGSVYQTDNGNVIYDCRFARIDDPQRLQQAIKSRAGIVETGLFIGIATVALVADEAGVRTITPASSTRQIS
jgi:ribose 5-phosphate isomerase A